MPHWRIEGFDGAKKIFEADVTGRLGDQQIVALLQRLAARHLEPEEIIASSLPKRAAGYRGLLERNADDRGRGPITVGHGTFYLARRTDERLPRGEN